MNSLKSRYLVIVLVIGVLMAGCATPFAVRTLSEEQVKAQESYLKSQKEYFGVIEHFVETQIKVTEVLIEAATSEINNKYKKKAFANIDPSDEQKTREALDQLTKNVIQEYKSDQEGLSRIKGYYAQLKELHQNMLKSLGIIVTAQRKLNEYIQLKKADEVAANQLLAIVGIEKEKVDQAVASAATIYAEIEKYIQIGAEK